MRLVQVVAAGSGWEVVLDGEDAGSFPDREQAEEAARATARGLRGRLEVHGPNGDMVAEESFAG